MSGKGREKFPTEPQKRSNSRNMLVEVTRKSLFQLPVSQHFGEAEKTIAGEKERNAFIIEADGEATAFAVKMRSAHVEVVNAVSHDTLIKISDS